MKKKAKITIEGVEYIIFVRVIPHNTLISKCFEQNQTPVFSIQIPSTNFDFIQSKLKFDAIKVVMEF